MRAHARAALALLTYQRAVAAARANPTRTAWARLLAAARNLGAARRELARGRRGARQAQPDGSPRLAGDLDAARVVVPLVCTPRERWDRARGRAAAATLPERPARAVWSPDLAAEVERARALVAWSTRLVAEARILCAETAALLDASRG